MSMSEGKKHKKYYNDAYIEVFSNQEFIRSLLEDMVGEEWVSLIDFSSMQVKSSVFSGISDDKKESDLLLSFSLKNQSNLLIYVLLEFQSTYEKMFFRLWEYLLRIYRKQYEAEQGLSVVVPVVIYNGEGCWKEGTDFMSYFQPLADEMLRQYIPAFRYILIDINKLDNGWLSRLKSAVGYFFLLDKTDLEQVETAYNRIRQVFKEIGSYVGEETATLLKRYLIGLLAHQRIDKSRYLEYIINNEGKSMLIQSIERIEKKGIKKGIEQGIEQGIEKGTQDTQIKTVKKMLQKKYPLKEIAEITGLTIAEIKSIAGLK